MHLSRHARACAQERNITLHEIQQVADDYEVSFTDRAGNPCYVRRIGGRRIKVVIAADDPNCVITVIDLDES